MNLARGFKADCERLVRDVRREMLLDERAPIDMDALADLLDVPAYSLGHLLKMIGATRCRDIDEIYSSVSAFTVFNRSHRTIVFNESHGPARHRSNMAHELAHALLMHPAERSGVGEAQELLHEKEATWLGGVLMLTADQAHQIATCKLPDATAMHLFCVSPEMLRYRLNVTGAAKLARGRNLPAIVN